MSFSTYVYYSNSLLLTFFGDFYWSIGKIKLFLHLNKNTCVGIFDIIVLDCIDNNELYIKLYNFHQIKYSKECSKAYLKALALYMMVHLQNNGETLKNEQEDNLCDVT